MMADPPTAEIEVGDRFTSEDYELTFEVISGDDITGAYDIVCLTEGIIGNLESGTLIPVDEINGLESAKIQGAVLYDDKGNKILDDNGNETYKSAVIVPGVDEEDVETFRERYFSSLQSKAFGGNREDYINKIKENSQVGACKVMRSSITEYVPNDTVKQWISEIAVDSTVSTDVKSWLSDVTTAIINNKLSTGGNVEVYILDNNLNEPSEELIKELKTTLDPTDGGGDGIVPIGHCVNVQSAKLVNVDFDITVSLKQGYSVDDVKASVKEVVNSALADYKSEWETSDNTELTSIQFLTIYNARNYITMFLL
ncbi:MAG: baseplate J/gp47 family protein [Eubacterium sp.]